MTILKKISDSVIEGNELKTISLVEQAIKDGNNPLSIIKLGLLPGIDVVGNDFKAGNVFIPEVLMSAQCMKKSMELLQPLITQEQNTDSKILVVLGTVAGDLHDIGKNLVKMLMESNGIEVIDLGVDVKTSEFIEAIKKYNPNVLALSALLTTTMHEMKYIIENLYEEGLRDYIKIIVGGAPVTKEFADEIGADGWAPDAASAKDLIFEIT